jgi:hypothetical protein
MYQFYINQDVLNTVTMFAFIGGRADAFLGGAVENLPEFLWRIVMKLIS